MTAHDRPCRADDSATLSSTRSMWIDIWRLATLAPNRWRNAPSMPYSFIQEKCRSTILGFAEEKT
jgi:hypothetical protein